MDCRSESASGSVPPTPTNPVRSEYAVTRTTGNCRRSHIPAPVLRHASHRLRSRHRVPVLAASPKRRITFRPDSGTLRDPDLTRKGSGPPCEPLRSKSRSCHREIAASCLLWRIPLLVPHLGQPSLRSITWRVQGFQCARERVAPVRRIGVGARSRLWDRKTFPIPLPSATSLLPAATPAGIAGPMPAHPGNRRRQEYGPPSESVFPSGPADIRFRPTSRGARERSAPPDRGSGLAPESRHPRPGGSSSSRILPASAAPASR